MENKGGSEISEIRVQPGSFTLSPTMAARSDMQENTFNMGDGGVTGRGTLPTATGEGTTGHLGPWSSDLQGWFLIIGIFQILVLNLLFRKNVSRRTRPQNPKGPLEIVEYFHDKCF